ncbi:hypothetical protein BEL55_004297 [Salmonella enterica subsp. enterica serovar Waycross]|nr:hypothetical protein [Salmonella enterica subsp. enterica serovar Waycross]
MDWLSSRCFVSRYNPLAFATVHVGNFSVISGNSGVNSLGGPSFIMRGG